jgi:hypothetical protein
MFLESRAWLVCKADVLTAICYVMELVWTVWRKKFHFCWESNHGHSAYSVSLYWLSYPSSSWHQHINWACGPCTCNGLPQGDVIMRFCFSVIWLIKQSEMSTLITFRGSSAAITNSVLDLQSTIPGCRKVLDGCSGIVPEMFVTTGALYELEVFRSSG